MAVTQYWRHVFQNLPDMHLRRRRFPCCDQPGLPVCFDAILVPGAILAIRMEVPAVPQEDLLSMAAGESRDAILAPLIAEAVQYRRADQR